MDTGYITNMKPGKFILYICYLAVTTLVFLEAAIRLWGYSQHYIYDPIYEPDPHCEDIPYIHKPCLHHARARGLAVINTDSLGLRSLEICAEYGPPGHGELRIAVTGDSVTFGEGIADTLLTYPAQLEIILQKQYTKKRVRVFNFGVSAYSVKEMSATAVCRMPRIRPDIMIMAVIPEDFNLKRIGAVDRWGYTVHASGEGVTGSDSVLKRLLRNIHLTYLIRDICCKYTAAEEKSREAAMAEDPAGIPQSYVYVKKFRDAARNNNARALLLLLPSLGHRFQQKFIEQLRHDGITFLDLSDIVHQFSKQDYMASPFDPHPSAAVHRVIARKTAVFLELHFL